jgi:hypothetical protein
MPIVGRQWTVTTDGTFDFNDPANWQFGIVPGVLDAAVFNTNVNDTVTGNATLAELLITQGLIHLTGSYTMSGAQPTELSGRRRLGAGDRARRVDFRHRPYHGKQRRRS